MKTEINEMESGKQWEIPVLYIEGMNATKGKTPGTDESTSGIVS